jgi:hypothetical protein
MSIMCGLLNLVHAILTEALKFIANREESEPYLENVPDAKDDVSTSAAA